MRYSEDYFLEKYKLLPKNIKEMIYSIDVQGMVKVIANKHNLHIDIAGILDDETMFVIIGLEKAVNFIRNLKMQIKLPDEKINAIAKDVNEKIFVPIRETMKDVENTYTNTEKAGELNTVKDNITKPQISEREIHYPNLANSSNSQDIDQKEESEEIKKHIAQQQNTKPIAPPPPNLPTGNLEASPPSEKKRPYSEDPYREPID